MKKTTRWLAAIGALWLVSSAAAFPAVDVKGELLRILDVQKAAWNRQDMGGFMAYYWKSDRLTYQSGADRFRGWNSLLERYQKSYSGASWGALDFTDLEVNVLSADAAYVIGRWRVALKDAAKEGVFTIVFRRLPEGWRIVHDHSS